MQCESSAEQEPGAAVTRAASAAAACAANPLLLAASAVAAIKVNAILPAEIDGKKCWLRVDKVHKGAKFTVGVCSTDRIAGEKPRATRVIKRISLADIREVLCIENA